MFIDVQIEACGSTTLRKTLCCDSYYEDICPPFAMHQAGSMERVTMSSYRIITYTYVSLTGPSTLGGGVGGVSECMGYNFLCTMTSDQIICYQVYLSEILKYCFKNCITTGYEGGGGGGEGLTK